MSGKIEPRTDEPLRILRVTSDIYPEVAGGLGLHAHSMSERQAQQGHEVTVLTSDHGDSSLPRVEERSGYTIVRHREVARPFGNSVVPRLLQTLRHRAPDASVIHAHSHLFFSTNLAALVRRFSATPLVVTNHGLYSQTAPKWLQDAFLSTVAKFTFNAADTVLCYTETDRDRLRERGITTDVRVVPNGIDCEEFFPDPSVPERRQLLFVGRLQDGKGLRYLVDAFERVSEQHPELRLKVVGDGPERGRYERYSVERGVADRTTFTGELPYAEMSRQYNESMLFVLPSLAEGLPRTVLESLACGTPVVTTDLPQMESVVRNAGYTVPRRSVGVLADAITRLVNEPRTRRRMARVGRTRVAENYSWESTVEGTTATYYRILSGRRGSEQVVTAEG